jgi:hypothetical protein
MFLTDVSPLVTKEASAELANRAGVRMHEITESELTAEVVPVFLLLQAKGRIAMIPIDKMLFMQLNYFGVLLSLF